MDYTKVDKDGNKLESIMPAANQKIQAGHYEYWLEHPESVNQVQKILNVNYNCQH
jgi:hypothetical protein